MDLDNDDDDMQLGATKGTFGSSNRHRHGYSRGGSKGRWTWDLSYEVTKKIKDNFFINFLQHQNSIQKKHSKRQSILQSIGKKDVTATESLQSSPTK